MCDHVISRTHVCCRHFVTNLYSVGVSADTLVLQNDSWGDSTWLCTYTCVLQKA